ncbi:NAD(P)H-dependent oxidoreductase [Leptospira gomenensis]|uniref:NAD(P)H-dependent oxidoreductase n=1 Tax=Leptospira gomenensis TaxID=2484974 RepID=A0A5F1YCS4_9LEPT|nr:NADPH-dependent FMN reductase [Leptospira gomenensis]TGK33210.1 NAD(P)H-dependent oxidoreductase [Leptospira gomenensis]TGK35557.1 NAD(P)H-dependent oxidoreductase [Leptospira gomenensis]TGK40881.1 NAD(P)H-dependent oxidoreductase [Leptospira gomenensis]TGK61171.1 NAD(P)H-dependent oxidoreductase [Leptospira gomenensis]
MKILSISGSIRFESNASALLRAIAKIAPPEMEIITYSGLDDLPHFSPDRDGDSSPESVKVYREALKNADGVILCTPEYAHNLPGVLKNSLDWVVGSGEYVNKPVMALGSSPSYQGGEKALRSLLTTLRAMNAGVAEECSFPIPLSRRQLDEREEWKEEEMRKKIKDALVAFAEEIRKSIRDRENV